MASKKRPDQVRRRNTQVINVLPAGGRKGQAPAWPLGKATPAERKLWNDLWSRPQAVVWEQWYAMDVVAQYVKIALRAQKAGAPVGILAERRQMQMQLGLLPGAVFKLQWTLAEGSEIPNEAITDLDAYRKMVK